MPTPREKRLEIVTLRMQPEERAELGNEAAAARVSISAFVRHAIEQQIRKRKRERERAR